MGCGDPGRVGSPGATRGQDLYLIDKVRRTFEVTIFSPFPPSLEGSGSELSARINVTAIYKTNWDIER